MRAERAEKPCAATLLTHLGGLVETLAALSHPLSLGDRYAMYVAIAVRMLACYTPHALCAWTGPVTSPPTNKIEWLQKFCSF